MAYLHHRYLHPQVINTMSEDNQSEYYTVGSYISQELFDATNQSSHFDAFKISDENQTAFKTTLSTTKMSEIRNSNQADSDSCFGEFTDIVQELPQNLSLSKVLTAGLNEGQKMNPIGKSNWINEAELKCIVWFQGKDSETVVRINEGELVIVNEGCRFKLEKITKIKALYENYQKCLWLTFQEGKGAISSQQRLKIGIEKDPKDDLYQLMARIVVHKLTLLEYDIDSTQGDSPEEDRFIMTGEILKKSQYLGRWDTRKMIITDRIESFREGVCTFQIAGIRQIWTRFQVQNHGLVLKIRHGMLKTQLGLPIVNYNARFCKENWLYRIYQLLSASSI